MISSASVRDIFNTNGIANVAIIDDVFDAPGESFNSAELESILTHFVSEDAIKRSLRAAGLSIKTIDDVTPENMKAVQTLAVSGEQGAADAWAFIKLTAKNRRVTLDALTSRLRKELKVSVKSIGAQKAKRSRKVVPDDSNVIFMDFELQREEASGDLSAELISRVYEQFKGRETVPLVILMSNLALTDADVATFQRQTSLLSGMFYFVHKPDLFDQERLHYRLAAFAKTFPTGQVLQSFVSQVESSLDAVRVAVFKDIRSLSISDYAFLQTMRLHDDGQPLGEYLMWMIGAHVVRELGSLDEMKNIETKVNKLSFEHLPPTQALPSSSFSSLYTSAVMRVMPPLPDAPHDPATYLQFGDLFRKADTKKVWVCVTPACDLAFSVSRPPSSTKSIMFVPGELWPLDKPLKAFEQRQPRTELVRLDGKVFRIVWNTKEVVQTKWSGLQAWIKKIEAQRVARLNTPFALDVQRSFAADLTRIGMPVPPPLYNPVKVRLTCLGEAGAEVELTSSADAFITGSERGERLVLGQGLMDDLTGLLKTAEDFCAQREKALTKQGNAAVGAAAEAKKAKEMISAARKDANMLSSIRGPFILPSTGEFMAVLNDFLFIANEASVEGAGAWIPLRLQVLAPSAI